MMWSLLLFSLLPLQDPPLPESALPDVVIERETPGEGRVTLNCAVRPGGELTDCRVVSETPRGAGLGRMALQGARRARVAARPADSEAADPRVTFTMRFQLDD